MGAWHVVGLGALAASAPACLRHTSHACVAAAECGLGGVCEPDGHCSFADPVCGSGRRYGAGAGALSGACVGGDGLDAGDADATGADASIDAVTDLIAHVPTSEEILGTVTLSIDNNAVVDTTGLTYEGAAQPWLTAITSEQGTDVALARLDELVVTGGKRLDVRGALPLIIVARTIDVQGTVDVSAAGTSDGAGAIVAGTSVGGAGGSAGSSDDGGGGGAGHGTAGGAGGGTDIASGGDAGEEAGDPDLVTLVGGGRGGPGAATGCPAASGGGGGGALQLYAAEAMDLGGTLDAGGGGGRRNSNCTAGGGGGGAGGALYLQTGGVITIATGARLVANGGGGASGGGAGGPGSDGADGGQSTSPAVGGPSVALGGSGGGAGGALASDPIGGGTGNQSGGGGGGAVGRIVVRGPTVTIGGNPVISPAPVQRN